MKLLLLLSTTVFFVATGAEGLKCYNCMGDGSCSTEMACPDVGATAACIKTFVGEKDKLKKVWKSEFSDVAAAARLTEHQIEI